MSFQSRMFPATLPTAIGEAANSSRPDCVCVVVPCYNEAKRLSPDAFLSALRSNPGLRFVFVNDGSKDATIDVLNLLAMRGMGRVDVVDLVRNGGKAEAVRQGLIHAIAAGHDIVGYWDADLATPLDAIDDMARVMRRLSDVEVVFGSRRALLGHRIDRTIGRRIVSRICATLARFAVRLPVGDTQCGAKLFRSTAALSAAVSKPFTAGWLFDVELFARISQTTQTARRAFFEYPLVEWTEIPGSKVTSRAVMMSGVRMVRLIGAARFGRMVGKITPPPAGNLNAAPTTGA